ncbi:MAG: O-phosphoserine--tRNA ligase [Candidatus Nanoarchaeia archaeon]|nr:O-phosphoserine--tRNA ligase [Candidatus Nanoarchaeia archaeon]
MVIFEIDEIKKESVKNFEKTWLDTANLIPKNTEISLKKEGKLTEFRDLIQKCRKIFSNYGFIETENKTLISTEDVYKEYGPESPAILDRAFFVAKLPRPNIGLSKEKAKEITKILGKEFDEKKLKSVLKSYKKGKIEGDDFVEALIDCFECNTSQATEIIEKVLSEFKSLQPLPTNITFRSHMTGTWYHTLEAMVKKNPKYPIALFSVGPRYRNEQKEDERHLRVHHSVSCVIIDPNMSLEAGEKIIKEVLKAFGFEEVNFITKKATSKYYANGMEKELFIKWKDNWLEIGDIGMYSPISLANFNISYPVFNAGFGVERLLMVLQQSHDIRDLIFPQFSKIVYDINELKNLLQKKLMPKTELGNLLSEKIEQTVRKFKNEKSPCSFNAYEDDKISVIIYENELDKKLVGPATFNELYIEDGNILFQEENGPHESFDNYLHLISLSLGAQIEKDSLIEKEKEYSVKLVKSLSNINLTMSEDFKNYLLGLHKKIEVKGPIFLNIKYKKKE